MIIAIKNANRDPEVADLLKLVWGCVPSGMWYAIGEAYQIVAAGALSNLGDGLGLIHAAAVHPDHRRRGFHLDLLRLRCEAAWKIGLDRVALAVMPNNTPVLKNVEREGFIDCGPIDGVSVAGCRTFIKYAPSVKARNGKTCTKASE